MYSTHFQKQQVETELTSGDSEGFVAPREIFEKAERTCQLSQFRPSSQLMKELFFEKVVHSSTMMPIFSWQYVSVSENYKPWHQFFKIFSPNFSPAGFLRPVTIFGPIADVAREKLAREEPDIYQIASE